MDIDSIFGLFKTKVETTKDIILEDYTFKIKMFSKLVIKGNVRKELLIPLVKELNPECSVSDINKEGECILYNRSFLYVQDFDPEDNIWIKAVWGCGDVFLVTALQICMKYFEKIEEYEKCHILQKILIESFKVVASHKRNS
jgi:hypothetical protein